MLLPLKIPIDQQWYMWQTFVLQSETSLVEPTETYCKKICFYSLVSLPALLLSKCTQQAKTRSQLSVLGLQIGEGSYSTPATYLWTLLHVNQWSALYLWVKWNEKGGDSFSSISLEENDNFYWRLWCVLLTWEVPFGSVPGFQINTYFGSLKSMH